jgi:5-formyltetrahydrofolate cyclo-ligase
MSESDGMDEFLDGGMRQSFMIASRIAESLARRRQESQRQQEHQDAQVAHEAQARLTADRSAAHAALAPVNKDEPQQAGPLVEAELVALDVQHHEARVVFLIGR